MSGCSQDRFLRLSPQTANNSCIASTPRIDFNEFTQRILDEFCCMKFHKKIQPACFERQTVCVYGYDYGYVFADRGPSPQLPCCRHCSVRINVCCTCLIASSFRIDCPGQQFSFYWRGGLANSIAQSGANQCCAAGFHPAWYSSIGRQRLGSFIASSCTVKLVGSDCAHE